jgi:16S rRNA (cytidine1402-2'-O)-methyltransferase
LRHRKPFFRLGWRRKTFYISAVAHTLYLVSTPIGNLEDITLRALRILKEVSLILAEDTRHTRVLLAHYGITTRCESYHDFNKERVGERYLRFLEEEGSIALVSDAGTPSISDPGFNLTRDAIAREIPVVPIPGASALLAALVGSGLPTDQFFFGGFLPKKSAQRMRLFSSLRGRRGSQIFYVSPHQMEKVLDELCETLSGATVVLARELTKKFEEYQRGTPEELRERWKEHPSKGEFVLLLDLKQLTPLTGEIS